MSSSVDLIPHLREQSTSVNLSTLQKKDGQISRLLFTAKHVVLYHMNPDTGAVDRQQVEGPLFLVERRSQPFYELILLNRKSITDWRYPVTADISQAMEVQEKYLYFQSSPEVVITLWFHEEPDCVNAEATLKRVCAHLARSPPSMPPPPFELPATAPQPQPQPTALASQQKSLSAPQPQTKNNNATSLNNSYQQQQQQPQQPTQQQAAPFVPIPVATTAPAHKSYASPYAPPPAVELNVALQSSTDRELQQRLNGFLQTIHQADQHNTKAYGQELKSVEAQKKENARRYAEEERRRQEHEAREARQRVGLQPSPSPPLQPQPLSADQLSMLASFSSASLSQPQAAPAIAATPAAASTPADAASELGRNLAAAKARKAARATPAAPAPAAAVSTLPASLLFAASQSSSAPPMPTMTSSSPLMRPTPQPSTLLPMAAGSPLLQASPQPEAIHPLLAMLSQNVQKAAQPLPAMPTISAQAPAQTTFASSYAAQPDAPTASTPALLAPSHFLTAAAATSTPAPAATSHTLLSTLTGGSATPLASSPPMMTRAAFQSYILSLCNDAPTVDWLYQRHLARPGQHPFA